MKLLLFFVFLFFFKCKWLIISVGVKKYRKNFLKRLLLSKYCVPLQPQSREKALKKRQFEILVR